MTGVASFHIRVHERANVSHFIFYELVSQVSQCHTHRGNTCDTALLDVSQVSRLLAAYAKFECI